MRRTGRLRPNLAADGDNSPVTGNPDRWFDPEQFVPSVCRAGVYCYTDSQGRPFQTGVSTGTPRASTPLGYQVGFWGNLGSNTVIGPGLAQFDFSVAKTISVTETMRFQFRSEFFNLFNTPAFRIPGNSTLYSNNGSQNVVAGRIDTTRNTERQIQLALKFIF